MVVISKYSLFSPNLSHHGNPPNCCCFQEKIHNYLKNYSKYCFDTLYEAPCTWLFGCSEFELSFIWKTMKNAVKVRFFGNFRAFGAHKIVRLFALKWP